MWHKITVYYGNTSRGYILLNSLPAFAGGKLAVGSAKECDIALPFKGVPPVFGHIAVCGGKAAFIPYAEEPEEAAPAELRSNSKLIVTVGVELHYTSFNTAYIRPAEKQQHEQERTGSFWKRLSAFLVDASVVLGLTYVFSLFSDWFMIVLRPLMRSFLFRHGLHEDYSIWWWLLISLAYYTIFEWSTLQATPGKLAVGVKVADMNGRRLGFGRALIRNLSKFVSFVPLCIGFFTFYGNGATLHDKIAGCKVIER